jgi:hypothetical protein
MQYSGPPYGKHRYLTQGEASRFVTRGWQVQEATLFAGRRFTRLMYFTCDHPAKFPPEVTETLTALENRTVSDRADPEATTDGAARSPLLRSRLGEARYPVPELAVPVHGVLSRQDPVILVRVVHQSRLDAVAL